MKIKRHYLKKTLEWLLPYTCILCKYPASGRRDLCSDCQQTLLLLTHACHRCAIPLSSYQKELLCGSCLQHPPPFDITHALYFYEPPLPKLILSLKFNASLITARILGELLAEKIQETWYKNKALPQWIVHWVYCLSWRDSSFKLSYFNKLSNSPDLAKAERSS